MRETYHQLLVNNLRAKELVRMSHDLMPINKPEPGSYDFREVMEIVQEILVSNRDVLATLEEAISAIEMELRDMET